MSEQIRVWKLDDCEYVAAHTLDEALAWYESETGLKAAPEEAEEYALSSHVNAADEDEEPRIITFEQLIQEEQARGYGLPMFVGCDPHYL